MEVDGLHPNKGVAVTTQFLRSWFQATGLTLTCSGRFYISSFIFPFRFHVINLAPLNKDFQPKATSPSNVFQANILTASCAGNNHGKWFWATCSCFSSSWNCFKVHLLERQTYEVWERHLQSTCSLQRKSQGLARQMLGIPKLHLGLPHVYWGPKLLYHLALLF